MPPTMPEARGVARDWVNIDQAAMWGRPGLSGLDCGLAPGDQWDWGTTDDGSTYGGRFVASVSGSQRSARATATWHVVGLPFSPYFIHIPDVGTRTIHILGVDLHQTISGFDVPAGPTIREQRVPRGLRPSGWTTCTFYGIWLADGVLGSDWEAWLARSEPDTWQFAGIQAAYWTGTVDVYIEGGIPVSPSLAIPDGHPFGDPGWNPPHP
jgi:hypothetical protein